MHSGTDVGPDTDKPLSRLSLLDPNGNRYPRPMWFRVLRWIVRLWWVTFLIYPANVLFNVLSIVAHNGPAILLDKSSLAQALLIDKLLLLMQQRPTIVIPVILVAMIFILLGRWAHHDRDREQEVQHLRERQKEVISTVNNILTEQQAISKTTTSSKSQSPPFDERQLPRPEYFVGRFDDLEWVMQQMHAGRTTAITALNGLGGIGKTTLAAVAAHQLREEERFPDGIAVIFCNGLTDPIELLRRVLGRFDPQRHQPETTDLTTLYEVAHRLLKGKKALVVLDNVEPGLDVEKVLAPLKAAGATLLLTARQSLPRTAVPVEASRILELLSPEEALDLFTRSLGRGNVKNLSSNEREAAQRIVAALDRHTLAVKLAGAYAADLKLDLDALARNLEQDPLDVPEGEIPRAVMLAFARSTVTLPPDAHRLFAALAAFVTPIFSRNAALALAKGLGLAMAKESVDLLVLRALVGAYVDDDMPTGSDRERLRLHPLLRAFAAERFKLWTEDERNIAYYTVALYYATYSINVNDRALSADEANIIGAVEWAHARSQNELVAALCSGLRSLWLLRLRLSASQVYLPWGITAANSIAEATKKREDRLRAADLALTLGQILRYIGILDEAEKVLEENLAIRQEVADLRGEGEVLTALGQLLRRSGRTALAEQYLQRALTIFQQVSNQRGEGLVRLRLGRIARRQGRLDEAERYSQEALRIDRETHIPREEALAVVTLGQIAHDRGQLREVEPLYKESLVLARGVKDPLSESIALTFLGRLAYDRGRLEEAKSYYEQSLTVVREVRNRLGESVNLLLLGQLAQAHGKIKEAKRSYEQSLAIAREVHDRRGEGTAFLYLGQLAQAHEQIEEAKHSYEQSLTIAREVLDRRVEGIDLSLLGQLAQACREMEEAKRCYEQSLAIAREVQNRRDEGVVLGLLGQLAQACGEMEEAKRCYEQSLAIAREVQNRRDEGVALSHLGQLTQVREEMEMPKSPYEQGMTVAREVQNRFRRGVRLPFLGQTAKAQSKAESAENYFRQGLDILRELDTIKYAAVALIFGTFLIARQGRRRDGCPMIIEAVRLYTQMGLPVEREASKTARQLGCEESEISRDHQQQGKRKE